MTAVIKKLYSYRATDSTGTIIKGENLASNKAELYQQLLEKNYYLISSRPKISLAQLLQWRSPVKTQELLDFCLHMQYMDQAGVPLLDALADAKSTSDKVNPIIEDMIASIKTGKMLSQAMADYPDIFPEMFSHIIYLSEQSGQLAAGFQKLYNHLSWSDQNKRDLVKSIQYPAIVLALICVVLWMMSSFVIPQMHDLIQMSGTEVPYSSQMLLQINQGLIVWAPRALILVISGFFLMLSLRYLSEHHRIWQDRFILKLPVIGNLLQKKEMAMYLHFFHVCLSSHVDLLECLDYSKKAVGNAWLQEQLVHSTKLVREGKTLSQAMEDAKIFSSSTIRMMKVGEVTGHLIPLLAVLEQYQIRDLKRQMEKFIGFLQPALLGIIGLILIWIVLGIFYPMYDQLLVMEE